MARVKYFDPNTGKWEYADSCFAVGGNDSGGNADYVGVEPAYEDIPKIFFGGALQQTKDEKVVSFRYISKTDDFSGYAEIKAQGNSSMSYPKKNQTVKMFKDADCTEKLKVDFKGWGKQNKHVYKANWIDLTHARNVVSARLWGDVLRSRADYESLPELLRTSPNQGAVDGFPVKVYAAGVYQGRYTLNIPKDAWMANMDKDLDTHCILCGENYVSGCFRASANINESDWTDEIHDTVPASIKTRWNQVISFVMNSTDDEFRANLNQYFYVDSLIDYYLFGLASCGLDAFGKNQLYMTYDGQKWIATMYDMDSTWGLYWNGSKFVATDYARTSYEDMISGRQGNLLYIRLEQLFWSELQTRWAELKNGALSITNIINRFERFTDITPAELVKEDYASTTGDGKFTGIPSQSTNNIQQIRAFALARQAWTDAYVAGLTPEVEVPCTGISLNTNTLTFAAEGSQTLTATVTPDGCTDTVTWESDDTSIATVVDGVVTALANGSATITAKCGEYSASCSVAVSGIEQGGGEEALAPVSDGLVRYFDFSEYNNADTPAQVTDKSGSGAVFNLNGFTYDATNGFVDNMLVTNGTSGQYALCEDFAIDTTQDFTLELICESTVQGSNVNYETTGFGCWENNNWRIGFGAYWITWRSEEELSKTAINASKLPKYDKNGAPGMGIIGHPYHSIITWDASEKKYYIHGERMVNQEYQYYDDVGGTATGQLAVISKAYLGVKSDTNTYADGKIGMLRLYNRMLTKEEIKNNIDFELTIQRGTPTT